MPAATRLQMKIPLVFLLLFMIHISILVLFLGLQYDDWSLYPGAQTVRSGSAGPVSRLLGGMALTGCFFTGFKVQGLPRSSAAGA